MFFELRNHSVISYLAHAGLVHRAEVTEIIMGEDMEDLFVGFCYGVISASIVFWAFVKFGKVV